MKGQDALMAEWKDELRRAKWHAAGFFLFVFALAAGEIYLLEGQPLSPLAWLAVTGLSVACSLPFYLHARSRKPR